MQVDLSSLSGVWNYPTEVRFGVGRIAELAETCTRVGMARPMLVTDPGLAGSPMIADAVSALDAAGLATELFSDMQPNPLTENVSVGVAAYRAGGHDGVIAFGGGSALDVGKTIAFMSGQSRPLEDFEDIGDNWRRADPDGIAPVVAVPTTAGTGSEVGRATVIADGAGGRKRILFHPAMMPRAVIADPELTVGLPPALTAATGMDALTHNLEAYFAPGFHPLAEGIAVEGVRLTFGCLERAYADGTDLHARAAMLAAASMGATAFQKGLGGVHSISHAVGGLYGTHHGLTNAVVLPYVLMHNRAAIAEKATALARYIDLPQPEYDSFLRAVLDLRASLDIPPTLGALGVDAARADEVAALAYDDPTRPGNPIPLSEDDLRDIFIAAVDGRLDA